MRYGNSLRGRTWLTALRSLSEQLTSTIPRRSLGSVHCADLSDTAVEGRVRRIASWVFLAYLATALLGYTPAALAAIAYVQSNSASPNNSSLSTLSVALNSAQAAGDFNVVAVGWGSTTVGISSVTDTKGNTYTLAFGPTVVSSVGSTSIYYAKNIVAAAAGANHLTVTFSAAVPFPDVRVAEYSGISTTSPVDVTVAGNGTGTTSSSGSVTTTNANDLLVGSNWVLSGTTGAGSGFTQRQISGWDGDILEDEVVSATGSYTATAPISPSAAWIMQLVAFRAASSDTTPPTAPSASSATVISSSQINLSWSASTDNVGVTGYLVERCSGAGCTTFAQIVTPTATTYSDTGLTASTSYSYRIRATDAAGNLSAYSSIVSATTGSATIAYVQGNSVDPNTMSASSASVKFNSAQTAGNLNVVAVGWGSNTSGLVSSVTDTKGNTYMLAVGPITAAVAGSGSIYYAKNIVAAAAGTNTITVAFSPAVGVPDVRIAEYSGLSTTSPVDVVAASSGTGTLSSSGSVTTTNANDLLLGSNNTTTGSSGPGTGFTQRIITGFNGNILEDEIVSTTGSYAATAPLSPSGSWIMQLVAFKAAASGNITPPTVPSGLTSTVASSTQINLSWTASTDNVGVTAYLLDRCQGANCTTFAQIASPTTTSYSDLGVAPSTSYSYRVRATDAAGNLSGYSNTTAATTTAGGGGSTPPAISTPTNGTVVTTGLTITLAVSISAGEFPNGVAILGDDPLGNTDVQIPTGSAVTLAFSLPIPANTPSGTYNLTAVGSTSSEALVTSAPVTVSVERADQPTSIQVFPSSMAFGSIGDTRSIFVLGIFSDGSQIDLSNSSQLTISSENNAVATVQNGIVTSVASGQTYIDVNYGSATLTIPISVP